MIWERREWRIKSILDAESWSVERDMYQKLREILKRFVDLNITLRCCVEWREHAAWELLWCCGGRNYEVQVNLTCLFQILNFNFLYDAALANWFRSLRESSRRPSTRVVIYLSCNSTIDWLNVNIRHIHTHTVAASYRLEVKWAVPSDTSAIYQTSFTHFNLSRWSPQSSFAFIAKSLSKREERSLWVKDI